MIVDILALIQTGGKDRPNLHHVRVLFDRLLAANPVEAPFMTQLLPNSPLVQCKDFENGIVKLQSDAESFLTPSEKDAVRKYLKSEDPEAVTAPAEVSSFAVDALTTDLKRRRCEKSKYRSTLHVSATLNVCERLFSAARLILNHLRSNMDPASCELLLFLKFNRQFWDNPRIFDEVLADLRASGDAEANDVNEI